MVALERKKRSQAQLHLRVDSALLDWLRSYCAEQGIHISDFVREYLQKVKRSEERRKRRGQKQREADRRQLELFECEREK